VNKSCTFSPNSASRPLHNRNVQHQLLLALDGGFENVNRANRLPAKDGHVLQQHPRHAPHIRCVHQREERLQARDKCPEAIALNDGADDGVAGGIRHPVSEHMSEIRAGYAPRMACILPQERGGQGPVNGTPVAVVAYADQNARVRAVEIVVRGCDFAGFAGARIVDVYVGAVGGAAFVFLVDFIDGDAKRVEDGDEFCAWREGADFVVRVPAQTWRVLVGWAEEMCPSGSDWVFAGVGL